MPNPYSGQTKAASGPKTGQRTIRDIRRVFEMRLTARNKQKVPVLAETICPFLQNSLVRARFPRPKGGSRLVFGDFLAKTTDFALCLGVPASILSRSTGRRAFNNSRDPIDAPRFPETHL
ncbi:hypothetical protein [Burkholderia pseudomallei]|uniref:hypothetical protein n=1 Tax=Burkholderia pseudomallei TaxID=28450 RepID=UPI000F500C66|nr:hypothetical protein [Burkholderia pseudomallei]RSK54954.1 hypothetical protein DF122_36075 [Burkholderia pseudomallei]